MLSGFRGVDRTVIIRLSLNYCAGTGSELIH